MFTKSALLAVLGFSAVAAACHASSIPFGAASAYNVIAIGSSTLAGTVSTNADIGGRVAASKGILQAGTVGSGLNGDPFGSPSYFAFVSPAAYTGNYANIDGGGNAFSPSGQFNFNDGGHLVTSGSSGLDFAALQTTLDAQSLSLATLASTGIVPTTSQPGVHLVLTGTKPGLNVFNIRAAQFGSANSPIDINIPSGATAIVNVSGSILSSGAAIYLNGSQSSDNPDSRKVLFNFANATSLTINGQFNGSILAPFALLSDQQQIDGNIIAAQIGSLGEVHNEEFTGILADPPTPTPEPGSFALLGTGVLALAGAVRRRLRA